MDALEAKKECVVCFSAIPTSALECPSCHSNQTTAKPLGNDQAPPKPMPPLLKWAIRSLAGLAFSVLCWVLIMNFFAGGYFFNEDKRMAEQILEGQYLKSPADTSFRSFEVVTDDGNSRMVRVVLDAPNSYGVKMRAKVCVSYDWNNDDHDKATNIVVAECD